MRGIEPSDGGVGDRYHYALSESVIGLFKTEVFRRRGPWRSLEAVKFVTLEWVDWFNKRGRPGTSGLPMPELYQYAEDREHAVAA